MKVKGKGCCREARSEGSARRKKYELRHKNKAPARASGQGIAKSISIKGANVDLAAVHGRRLTDPGRSRERQKVGLRSEEKLLSLASIHVHATASGRLNSARDLGYAILTWSKLSAEARPPHPPLLAHALVRGEPILQTGPIDWLRCNVCRSSSGLIRKPLSIRGCHEARADPMTERSSRTAGSCFILKLCGCRGRLGIGPAFDPQSAPKIVRGRSLYNFAGSSNGFCPSSVDPPDLRLASMMGEKRRPGSRLGAEWSAPLGADTD